MSNHPPETFEAATARRLGVINDGVKALQKGMGEMPPFIAQEFLAVRAQLDRLVEDQAEILAHIKSQTVAQHTTRQASPAARPSASQTVRGYLGRDAKLSASGKMAMLSIENLDGLPFKFIRIKATKQAKEAAALKEGDYIEVVYSEVKEEPNYKDASKMDKFIWLESFTLLERAAPNVAPEPQSPAERFTEDDMPF